MIFVAICCVDVSVTGIFQYVIINYLMLHVKDLSLIINPYANDLGQVFVSPGDAIPGVPSNVLKVYADWLIFEGFTFSSNLNYQNYQYLRGDEANQNAPVPGFVVVNLLAEYQYNKNFSVFGRVDNLFGANYSNFGNFGDASGTLGPAFNNPRFYGPGSPTGGWAGFRVSF